MENISEKAIVEGLKSRNHFYFEILMEKYHGMIFAICRRYLSTYQEMEDITQEVFAKAYEKIDGFQGKSKLSSWLYRITVNECLMHLRKESKRYVISSKYYEIHQPISQDPSPIVFLMDKKLKESIYIALDKLKEKEQKALLLRFMEEKSTAEIASVLGITIAATKSRFHRARKKLRRDMVMFH